MDTSGVMEMAACCVPNKLKTCYPYGPTVKRHVSNMRLCWNMKGGLPLGSTCVK